MNSSDRHNELRSPLGRLAHALDDLVQSLLSALLESLRDGLHALFVCCIFKKTSQEMIEGHVLVLLRSVLEN